MHVRLPLIQIQPLEEELEEEDELEDEEDEVVVEQTIFWNDVPVPPLL